MMDMDEEYTSGGMIYTLEDEDGKEQEFELLDELDYGDASYCALVPYYEEKEQMLEDDGEFVVLKREMIDGALGFSHMNSIALHMFVAPSGNIFSR